MIRIHYESNSIGVIYGNGVDYHDPYTRGNQFQPIENRIYYMNNLFGNWGLYPSGPETEKQGGEGKS